MKIKNLRKEKELITQEMNEQTRPMKKQTNIISSLKCATNILRTSQ